MKRQWIKGFFAVSLLVLVACSGSEGDEKDEQFCKCMEAGEALNAFSETIWKKTPTAEDASKMNELKANKEKECKDYQTMDGKEMIKRKEKCGNP